MDEIKMKYFNHRNKGEQFPDFKTLSLTENMTLYRRIVEKTSSDRNILHYDLIDSLYKQAIFPPNINTKNKDFNLSKFLAEQQILPEEKVYLSWGPLDNIDSMRFNDLSKHFKDIWSTRDDLILFDDSLNWIILINHHGTIAVFKVK